MRWFWQPKPKLTLEEQIDAASERIRQATNPIYDLLDRAQFEGAPEEQEQYIDCAITQLNWARNYLFDAKRQDYRTRDQQAGFWRSQFAREAR